MGLLRGVLLCRDGILPHQLLVAMHVQLCLRQAGAVACERTFRLVQRGLIGPRIDLRQQLPGLHGRADISKPLLHIAGDLRIDGRGVKSLCLAGQSDIPALSRMQGDQLNDGNGLLLGPRLGFGGTGEAND